MCFYENSNLGRCLFSLGMLRTFSNKKSDSSIRKCYFPFVLGKLDRLVFFGGGGIMKKFFYGFRLLLVKTLILMVTY